MSSKTTHVFAEDMTDDMMSAAIEIAQEAFQMSISKGKVYSTIAAYIRDKFDKGPQFGGRGWNCVVGRSFGAFVTHEIKTYMYFTTTPGVYILLWKA